VRRAWYDLTLRALCGAPYRSLRLLPVFVCCRGSGHSMPASKVAGGTSSFNANFKTVRRFGSRPPFSYTLIAARSTFASSAKRSWEISARRRAHFKFAPNWAALPTLLPCRRGPGVGRRFGPTPFTSSVGRVPSATHSRIRVGRSGARSPHSNRLIAARSSGVVWDSCTCVKPASKRARRMFSPNARICSTIS
jgi:hypothetical protein